MQHKIEEFFPGFRAEILQDPPLLAKCVWCERGHTAARSLSVCPVCAARKSTLGALEMNGSYALTGEGIDAALTRTSAGNYALGYMVACAFKVFYVGRSDSDVRQRLHEWVGMPSRYDRYAPASKAAWALRSHPAGFVGIEGPALGNVVSAGSSYTRFAYSYAESAEAAFEKECRNFDDFGGSHELDNEARPFLEVA